MISFTPVRQADDILELHLAGLDVQPFDDTWFYDDNDEPTALLEGRTVLPRVDTLPERGDYRRGETDHVWPRSTVARVAEIKNRALAMFYRSSHDWIFLIDSDVLIPTGLVDHLLELEMPIVSAVYWSDWGDGLQPNVWDLHPFHAVGGFDKFREPAEHIVGGLGACTLLHKSAVESGVNFNPVRGVPYAGEDRHFSIRASAADIPLIACTHFDVFHVYHDSQIEEARTWATRSFPSRVT